MPKIWKASEFAKRKFERPPWLIEGLLPARGITMIYAWGKVGKSIMTMQLAHALTTGSELFGKKPDKTWKVLYYQSDEPEDEWGTQLEKVNKNENWDTMWDMPCLFTEGNRRIQLRRQVEEGKYDLIAFDSLLSCSEPLDMEDKSDVRKVISRIRFVTQDKPSWLINHKIKGTPGIPANPLVSAAGSFALSAGVSTLIDLRETGENEGQMTVRGRYVKVSVKLKRGPAGIWLLKGSEDLYAKP